MVANPMSSNATTNDAFSKLGDATRMMIVEINRMKPFALRILPDRLANTMSGCVKVEINVFPNRFIVTAKWIARTKVTKLAAVSMAL